MVQQPDKEMILIRSRTVQRSPSPENFVGDGSYASLPTASNDPSQQQLQQSQTPSACCCDPNNSGSSSDGGCQSNLIHFNSSSTPHHHQSVMTSNSSCDGSSSGQQTSSQDGGHLTATVKFELGRIEVCEGCGQGISDRYVMRVADGSWHEECLVCCVCRAPLVHSCFTRAGRIYCRQDYDRAYGAKCGRCGERLYPQELVMRAGSSLAFHLPCFGCSVCGRPLQKGDQFVVRPGGQLLCRQDLDKDLESPCFLGSLHPQSTNNNNNGEEDSIGMEDNSPNRPRHDGRRGPKRPRTILTSGQRRQFKASFEISPKPCRKVREALAKETGLSVRVVQVWFQNQRAKMKKLQRKAKIEADKGGQISDKNIKDEHGGKSKKRFVDGETRGSSLLSNMPYSPNGDGSYAGQSGDSMCGSDLSMDDSGGFDQMDDGQSSLSGVDLHEIQQQQHQQIAVGSSPQHHMQQQPVEMMLHQLPPNQCGYQQQQQHPHPISNPIDKLYLMQNAYFRLDQ